MELAMAAPAYLMQTPGGTISTPDVAIILNFSQRYEDQKRLVLIHREPAGTTPQIREFGPTLCQEHRMRPKTAFSYAQA